MSVRSLHRNVLTSAGQGVFIAIESSCLLDLQFLRFTSKTEDICSLTDNEYIFEQACFRYSFYEKCAHLRPESCAKFKRSFLENSAFPEVEV